MADDDRNNLRNGDDNICRDFLRNVCSRGKNCKYQHPNGNEVEQLSRKTELVFCHDFQNKECRRANCRFIHCSRQEEDYYHQSGELPDHVQQMLSSKIKNGSKGDIPICKDFLKGDCRRGGRCKFRHLSPGDLAAELGCINANRIARRDRFNDNYDPYEPRDRYEIYERRESYEPDLKRRHFDDHYSTPMMMVSQSERHQFAHSTVNEFQIIQEENAALKRKLETLRKQVADLTATNEFLLDQNAQLRLSKSTAAVTQAPPPALNPQPTTAPVPTIAQISQQLPITANSAELSASALQPAQPISVPVSLAQALAPVSLASVSIAQQLPASAVSLAQTIPQSIITMSGPSTPLVSYPIMTQSMRPPLPQSSLAH